jgi:hypothetical protein
MTTQDIDRNRDLQRELYGEPLEELIGRVATGLGITQGRLAEALGLSPAMLSQLRGAQRVKIGNPVVLERLRLLDDRAGSGERAGDGEVESLLREVRDRTGPAARTTSTVRGAGSAGAGPLDVPAGDRRAAHAADTRAAVRVVQDLLRAVAPADELLAAAAALADSQPEIAELLRVYGAGRTDAAIAHYERHAALV